MLYASTPQAHDSGRSHSNRWCVARISSRQAQHPASYGGKIDVGYTYGSLEVSPTSAAVEFELSPTSMVVGSGSSPTSAAVLRQG